MNPFEQAKLHFLDALEHHNRNRFDEAEVLYRKAHALMPERVSILVNLAAVLVQQQRLEEALSFCERALALEPGHPDALSTRALCSRAVSGPEQALQMLDRVIASDPRDVEALNNRGVVLRDLGRLPEALDSYDRALVLDPDHAGVLSNRASVLARLGRTGEALAVYRHALQVDPQHAPAGAGFIHLVLDSGHAPQGRDPEFEALAIRAIREPWARPVAVAPVLVNLLREDPSIRARLDRIAAAWPERLPPGDGIDALFRNPLLLALLQNAVIPDIGVERMLATLRGWLLQDAIDSDPGLEGSHGGEALAFHCALAMQCHLNDHLYSAAPGETAAARALAETLAHRLDAGDRISAQWLVAVATFFPLASVFPAPERLLDRQWPEPVQALLAQQVAAPLRERASRGAIPRLTPIDDDMSRQVQRQYEESPYPKWAALVRPGTRVSLQDFLRNRVPGTDLRIAGGGGRVMALNAGCGTGQQPIDTALRLAGVDVLAVDLSLASLGYATRMADELGLKNILFAQADILRLASITQRFDLIESTGVLHHLREPVAGLRVLASLLKPDGVMRLALYSETARRAVVAARALIAARGYAATADDIRRCREEILALPDGRPEKRVAVFSDFHSLNECRDLLFHVCEHRYTIAGLCRLLDEANLRLIGFELEPAQHAAFARAFPDPATLADLDAWAAFESRNPDAFARMYQFWVRRAV